MGMRFPLASRDRRFSQSGLRTTSSAPTYRLGSQRSLPKVATATVSVPSGLAASAGPAATPTSTISIDTRETRRTFMHVLPCLLPSEDWFGEVATAEDHVVPPVSARRVSRLPGPNNRSGVGERTQAKLEHVSRLRRNGSLSASAQTAHPDDGAARRDERQPVAFPAWHLSVDEQGFEPALTTSAERQEAIALSTAADHERASQLLGIEGHALRLARHLIPRCRHTLRLQPEAKLGQRDDTGHDHRAGRQRGWAGTSEPHERTADLERETTD